MQILFCVGGSIFDSSRHDAFQKSRVHQESILQNFDFFVFPIFAIKLGHFKAQKKYFLMLKKLKLNSEKQKKSLFNEEKSFVGLTPSLVHSNNM